METCSTDPLLETNEICKGCAANLSFPERNCLLPYIKSPPVKGLQLCEQKEIFAREYHLDTSECQDFIYSYNSEVRPNTVNVGITFEEIFSFFGM